MGKVSPFTVANLELEMIESWAVILFTVWMNGSATPVPLPSGVKAPHIQSIKACDEIGEGLVAGLSSNYESYHSIERLDYICVELKNNHSI